MVLEYPLAELLATSPSSVFNCLYIHQKIQTVTLTFCQFSFPLVIFDIFYSFPFVSHSWSFLSRRRCIYWRPIITWPSLRVLPYVDLSYKCRQTDSIKRKLQLLRSAFLKRLRQFLRQVVAKEKSDARQVFLSKLGLEQKFWISSELNRL